jgi:phage gpG-like protein
MDMESFARQFGDRMNEVKAFVEGDDIKHIMGVEAVNHFKNSFKDEGFTDRETVKWADVKRRDPDSSWYGHSGQTGKFSEARTKAPPLTGETRELQESISYEKIPYGVRVTNDAPYASVHQFGGKAKIYGKKEFTMIARPFMGKSAKMVERIKRKIKSQLANILKQ